MTRREFLIATAASSLAAGDARASELPATIRAAILGLDGHYSELTSATKALPNIHIVAVSDPNEEALRRAAFGSTFKSAATYRDHRELLAKEKLDLVCICGQNAGRAAIIDACAKLKLAIISEKPIALSLPELANVKRAIETERVPFTVLLTMRCAPPYQTMREIVRGGKIGEVVSMDAQKSYKLGERPAWMKSRETFGGTIPFISIHMLDLMRWISGRDMIEASAFQSAMGGKEIGEMENNCALAFRLDNGGTASMRIDYLRPEKAPSHGDDRLRIVGTKGIVEYQGPQGVTLVTDNEPLEKVAEVSNVKPLCVDFIESIYLKRPHLLSQADIFRISEIILKTRAAAEEKRIVAL